MWYVVQVGAGNEEHMKELLENFLPQGLISHVFFLLCESSYKKSGMRQIVRRPLFPGYLFLESAHSEGTDSPRQSENLKELEKYLKRLTEFHHLLGTGRVCTPVSVQEQEFFIRHTDRGYVMTMSRGYMIGRQVMVTDGAFAGYRGELKYVDRHNQYGVMEVQLGEKKMDMQFGLEITEKAVQEPRPVLVMDDR